jgi:hypothetical protein
MHFGYTEWWLCGRWEHLYPVGFIPRVSFRKLLIKTDSGDVFLHNVVATFNLAKNTINLAERAKY